MLSLVGIVVGWIALAATTTTTTTNVHVHAFVVLNPSSHGHTHMNIRNANINVKANANAMRSSSSSSSSSSQLFLNDNDNTVNNDDCTKQQQQQQQQQQYRCQTTQSKRDLTARLAAFTVATTVAVALVALPLPAHAGFGPSSGATTTPPPNLNSITTNARKVKSPENAPTENFNVDLDGKKLRILIDSALNSRQLEEFSGQLDGVIESLKDSASAFTAGDIMDMFDNGSDNGENESDSVGGDNNNNNNNNDSAIQYDAAARRARNAEREKDLLWAKNLLEQIQNQEQAITKLQNQPYWFNYFAAFCGSTVSTLVMHPLDTIKTRIQVGVGLGGNDSDDSDNGDGNGNGNNANANGIANGYPLPPDHHHVSLQDKGSVSAIPAAATSTAIAAHTISTASGYEYTNASANVTTVTEAGGVCVAEMTATAVTVAAATTATSTSTSTAATVVAIDGEMDTNSDDTTTLTTTTTPGKTTPKLFDNLYEGLAGNLFKEVPPSAVYLGVYETVKYALAPKVAPVYLLWVYLVAGSAGEVVGSIIRAPAEAVKSLVQSKAEDSTLEAVQTALFTDDGRANVVRAWSASIARDVPFGGIQLAVFETMKAYILNNPNIEIDSSTLLSEAVIGAFAGGLGAFVTAPADVVTTRIITQDTATTTTTTSGTEEGDESATATATANTQTAAPLGVLEMGKRIYREEGIGAFFIGWEARVGYWAPAIGIFLSCYCSVRQAGITYDLFP